MVSSKILTNMTLPRVSFRKSENGVSQAAEVNRGVTSKSNFGRMARHFRESRLTGEFSGTFALKGILVGARSGRRWMLLG
jgi:hypothetical protein